MPYEGTRSTSFGPLASPVSIRPHVKEQTGPPRPRRVLQAGRDEGHLSGCSLAPCRRREDLTGFSRLRGFNGTARSRKGTQGRSLAGDELRTYQWIFFS
ncbi:hypothetical protein E2C01_100530 [Portunus trituberculatus]|uniref:Uncharacterized protein n=1 Tax=Portunus trituberculatus TaxID=210409 RepID=A0A5B7KCG5_PORTR|nr:hypothetical protein [Portunus trituberculatus]